MAKKQRQKKQRTPVQHRTSSSAELRQQRIAREKHKKRLRTIGLSVAAALIIGFLGFLIISNTRANAVAPGDKVADQGNRHITENKTDSVTYNSKPPTSGPHFGQLANWGIHSDPIPDALQIHNLEDGGVGIWYNCPDGCPELEAQLAGIVNEVGTDRILLAPYPDMDARIALTAWNRIDKFEAFDRARILKFIESYRGIDHHRG